MPYNVDLGGNVMDNLTLASILVVVFYAVMTLALIGIGTVIVKLKKKKVSKAFAIAMFIIWLMVIVVVGGPLYIAGRGLPAGSGRITGEFTDYDSLGHYWEDEQWKIVSNKYGEPIFSEPKEAFLIAEDEFSVIIDDIQEQYGFDDFSPSTYDQYCGVMFKVETSTEGTNQAFYLHEFKKIYENSKKRWFWLPAEEWVRECF